jgi:hypothetical protein
MSQKEFSFFITKQLKETPALYTYPPQLKDLYSIYKLIRNSKALSVLEFGSGWSTLICAKALEENFFSYSNFIVDKTRHPSLFSLMTIDSSKKYQTIALKRLGRIPEKIKVLPVISKSKMCIVNDQICHTFSNLPPFTADFVYLDGPDCDQVAGTLNGFSVRFGDSRKVYGLPMSGDLILLEPYFWTGTVIVTDGRGANANFLRNNFKRNWSYRYDEKNDQHIFVLKDKPWGEIAKSYSKFRNEKIPIA